MPLIPNELFQNVMKQYLTVCGIAVITLAMIGTTLDYEEA